MCALALGRRVTPTLSRGSEAMSLKGQTLGLETSEASVRRSGWDYFWLCGHGVRAATTQLCSFVCTSPRQSRSRRPLCVDSSSPCTLKFGLPMVFMCRETLSLVLLLFPGIGERKAWGGPLAPAGGSLSHSLCRRVGLEAEPHVASLGAVPMPWPHGCGPAAPAHLGLCTLTPGSAWASSLWGHSGTSSAGGSIWEGEDWPYGKEVG